MFGRILNYQSGMLPNILSSDYDIINKVLSKFFTKWVFKHEGVSIFMHDPIRMLGSKNKQNFR